jgi:DNA polymerase elongation subunit (family B)
MEERLFGSIEAIDVPITTLDFTSLYPSIMQATVLLNPDEPRDVGKVD